MTVTYTSEVATSSFACFLKLLFRWRGSVYKLVWREFLIFAGLYFALSILYRFGLDADQKKIFEKIAWWCETYNNLIPVAFVLGFYVSVVVGRWWSQFTSIPWPDNVAIKVNAHLHGQDERARLMRRTIMRYVCLSFVITLSSISSAVKKRFPTFHHMTEAGFMTDNEQAILEKIPSKYNKFWVPLVWSTSLVTRARRENRIKDDFAVKTLIDEIGEVRIKLSRLFHYDWITVPLVYTQVVTLAVHIFIASCLMGRQFVEGERGRTADMYFPLFTFLQFFFYLGWLKVAETMVNPFGEDDDDFNTNFLIDRNMQLAYLIVDEMHQEHPELIRDQYWDTVEFNLPYTEAAQHFCDKNPLLGSAMNLHFEPQEIEFVHMSTLEEEVGEVVTGGHHEGSLLIASRPGIERRASHSPPRRDSYLPRLSLRGLSHHGSTRSMGHRLHRTSSRDDRPLHGEPPSPQTEADFALVRDEDMFYMSNSTVASHSNEQHGGAGEKAGEVHSGDDGYVDANKKVPPIDPVLTTIAEDESGQPIVVKQPPVKH